MVKTVSVSRTVSARRSRADCGSGSARISDSAVSGTYPACLLIAIRATSGLQVISTAPAGSWTAPAWRQIMSLVRCSLSAVGSSSCFPAMVMEDALRGGAHSQTAYSPSSDRVIGPVFASQGYTRQVDTVWGNVPAAPARNSNPIISMVVMCFLLFFGLVHHARKKWRLRRNHQTITPLGTQASLPAGITS